MMKKCSKCKKMLCTNEFNKNKAQADGFNNQCRACQKLNYMKNRTQVIGIQKLYREEHKIDKAEYDKKYQKNNKIKSAYNKLYKKQKMLTDISYRLIRSLRSRLNHAIKNNAKVGSAVADLGCSIEFFKQHIEQKFYNNTKTNENMTWDNYGLYGWHLDHIIPLSSFDLNDREQFLIACHYTNLQPLWAEDNLSKGKGAIHERL